MLLPVLRSRSEGGCIAASLLVLTSPMESPLALLCQQVLRRHALTSHGGAWESRGSPRRWTSNRTRCTCCRQGRAGELDPGHTRIRARSSTNRTIRSASRRPGARESGLNRTRIHARSSSNRNVCILSPCQFSFRRVVYQTNSPHANFNPQLGIGNIGTGNTLPLATRPPPPS